MVVQEINTDEEDTPETEIPDIDGGVVSAVALIVKPILPVQDVGFAPPVSLETCKFQFPDPAVVVSAIIPKDAEAEGLTVPPVKITELSLSDLTHPPIELPLIKIEEKGRSSFIQRIVLALSPLAKEKLNS